MHASHIHVPRPRTHTQADTRPPAAAQLEAGVADELNFLAFLKMIKIAQDRSNRSNAGWGRWPRNLFQDTVVSLPNMRRVSFFLSLSGPPHTLLSVPTILHGDIQI